MVHCPLYYHCIIVAVVSMVTDLLGVSSPPLNGLKPPNPPYLPPYPVLSLMPCCVPSVQN